MKQKAVVNCWQQLKQVVTVDETVKEFVAIDENIATESIDDWEEDLVRSYIERMKDSDDVDNNNGTDDDDDNGVISIPEPVLIIIVAYSLALKLQRLQEDDLTLPVDKLISEMEQNS